MESYEKDAVFGQLHRFRDRSDMAGDAVNFTYATPKPRLAVEIRLDRMPRHTALIVVLLTMATLISTVALWASTHSDVLDIPKLPPVPNVSVALQQHVDAAVKKVTSK